ncbi:hypothetical protein [Roseovarius pelagicus]|uniref:Uncharacterized protein n=1 Tax=Roseovarius pelagicus TaxID=2980108 RepID=A0ABY6DDD1_9RHOB|nr:hypothetical protein [Roseovarius pelagicus]UXX84157.1 hypothetical protein N7U68_05765 [Roseovarius pelagicus]
MKPNFALSLSFDGIALLHRRFPGWTLVDEVSLDTDDLQAALAELRAKAIALDPSGLRAKLVIPNDQIKYITIATTDDSDENSRDQAARAALEGATPYPVDELSYAWSVDGSDLKIAAVARETLDEAEAFAVDHAFAPVCFVAIPANGDFSGEPFFGETAHARSLLSKGATVTRDQTPIRIIGVSKPVTDASPVSPVDAAQEAEPPTLDSAPEATPAADIAIPAAPNDTADEDTVATPDQPAVTAPEQPDDEHASPKKSKSKPKDKTPPKGTKKSDSEVAGPFTSIRASRADPLGSAPKLDAPSRLRSLIANRKDDALRPGSADMDQTSAPELPSPGAEMTPDTAQIARAAASLRPDPAERLQNTAPASEPAPDPDKAPKITFFSGRKPRSARSNTRSGSVKRIPESNAKTRFEDEKQRMTVFGARHQQVGGKPRFLGLILMAVLLLFLVGVAAWASIFLDDGLARLFGGPKDINVAEMPGAPESEDNEPIRIAVPQTPQTSTSSESADTAAIELSDSVPQETVPEAPTLPAAEETASLADTPASSETLTPSASLARYAATGIWQMAPRAARFTARDGRCRTDFPDLGRSGYPL